MTDIYDLIVVGTGVAATTIAEKCRKAGWGVAIIDRRPYGGTCMPRGCDPKKLLWSVAATVDQAQRFARHGFAANDMTLSWPELIRFKRSFLKDLPERGRGRLRQAGIATLHGRAHFVDGHKIAVDGHSIEARHIAIASGSRPRPLSIPGAERLLTSDDFLELDELPPSLAFVGGGYISFEFAHIAARAGAKVTILHRDDRPLAQFDKDSRWAAPRQVAPPRDRCPTERSGRGDRGLRRRSSGYGPRAGRQSALRGGRGGARRRARAGYR